MRLDLARGAPSAPRPWPRRCAGAPPCRGGPGSTRAAPLRRAPRARCRRASAPRRRERAARARLPRTRSCSMAAGPVDVGRDQEGPEALVLEVPAQLGDARRLAGALETQDHDDRRRPGRHGEPVRGPAEQLDQLAVDDLHHLLARGEALEDLVPDCLLADTLRRSDRTTLKLTSASEEGNARRSRSASLMFSSDRRPAPRRRSKIASRRCVRASNIGSSRNLVGESRKALKTTGHPSRRQGSRPQRRGMKHPAAPGSRAGRAGAPARGVTTRARTGRRRPHQGRRRTAP